MSFDIEKFVVIDNHAHSLLRNSRELDEIGFRQCFSESRSLAILKDHQPHSVHYIDMLDHLEKIFNIKNESEYLAFRLKQSNSHLTQLLWDDVSIGAVIVDDGFNASEMMNLDELASVSGRPIFHCKRVEPIMEACIENAESFQDLCQTYQKKLFPKGKRRTYSLKTICGYRGGLELMRPSQAEAKNDFDKIKKTKTIRVNKSALYHFLLLQTFEQAAQAGVPVQVHTGIGDDDANLIDCNPALMQELFRSRTYAKTHFVLLHCYPYVREAAFMCSLYSNVYMDLSLSMTLASPSAASLVKDALSLAPASKLLAGSDGHSCPEAHWYGIHSWKRGLTFCLYEMINSGLITQREAEEIGALVLHDNAINLYKLEGLA